MNKKSALLSLVIVTTLAACGGGGSDSNSAGSAGASTPTASSGTGSTGNGATSAAPADTTQPANDTNNPTPPTADQSGSDTSGAGNNGTSTSPATNNPAPATATAWSIADISSVGPQMADNERNRVYDINEGGKVLVSYVDPNGITQAFVYQDGKATQLPNDGRQLYVSSLTDAGDILVLQWTLDNRSGPYNESLYIYRDGAKTELTSLKDALLLPTAMNNVGQMTVHAGPGSPDFHAYLYENGTLTPLDPSLAPSFHSYLQPRALNDNGHVVGTILGDAPSHAFLAVDGKAIDLGATAEYPYSSATKINNADQIIGSLTKSGGDNHFFLYSQGKLSDMGSGNAYDINNKGQIVGDSADGAFLYTDGKFVNLNDLPEVKASGWKMTTAQAVNDRGQVVAWGTRGTERHIFLLSPAQ